MNRKSTVFAVCLLMLAAARVDAHFIWLDLKTGPSGEPQARLYFGESAEPGNAHLLGKVAQTKVWVRDARGQSELTLAAAGGELAALVASCPKRTASSLEATCDYGVYSHGGPAVLLQYYAKHLSGNWAAEGGKLARAERLALDIVPSLPSVDRLQLKVLYQETPTVAGEVIIVDPAGREHAFKTSDQGIVELPVSAGRYAIRAAHLERDRGGKRGDKDYSQTWHYCTLTLDVPTPTAAAAGESVSAAELLRRARVARSVWQDFPGFSADLTVYDKSSSSPGKITIDADGNVKLDMAESPLGEWVEEQLQSLVQHRMPDGEVSEGDVSYADSDVSHPLGRRIDLGDGSTQSVYRIKDDVIREVSRPAGELRFTISVLETTRNPEGQYLPRAFTMNFFDAASGELRTSLAFWNDWQRVGNFDLPKTILEIKARDGGLGTRQIVFSNCKLLAAASGLK